MLAAKRSTIGHLTALSSGEEVPFGIRRLFFITDMPVGAIRGNHAHKTCEQFLFAIIGSVCIEVKDAAGGRLSFDLRAAEAGLYVPSRLWLVVRATSDRACLGVLASHAYDSEDYIRAWEDFIRQGSLS
jgi:dTDP-4-dehydrorhamnose 3,5-epimerase-like enzyme